MPIRRHTFSDLGLTVFRYFGDVTVPQNVEALLGYVEEDVFDPSYDVLVDQSASTLSEADFNQMHLLSSLLKPYFEARGADSLTVFFCPEDVQYGVTRMYLTILEGKVDRTVAIFRTRAECLKFLGFDPEDRAVHAQIWSPV